MKTITVSIPDDLYRRANRKATAAATSLPAVLEKLLHEWTEEGETADARRECVAAFLAFLDALAARPTIPGPSVGQLNREDLYERGGSRH